MKKRSKILIAIFTCFMACFLITMVVNAETVEEIKERWYDTHYYPVYQGNEEWQKHDMSDTLDILNPPLDLLLSMSTEELAKLMQEHPLMSQITTYYGPDGEQDYITFFSFLEINCDIFYELLRREDGITCLLQEYQTHELDVKELNEGIYSSVETEQTWFTEIFGCQFIRYYSHHFTDNEYALASQIIEEKKELYSLFNDTLLYYFDLSEIEPTDRENMSDIRTNYLSPEEIQEKEDILAAALLQMQSKESSLQTETPDTEVSDTANREENNEGHRKLMIAVGGAIIGVVCLAGLFVFIRRRRMGEE